MFSELNVHAADIIYLTSTALQRSSERAVPLRKGFTWAGREIAICGNAETPISG